ncbi:MAG: MFS transporter, partial [Bifidobacteriaceae bacterium]|nr:MFS transporter [Bifidobacteriaceae bacterium]
MTRKGTTRAWLSGAGAVLMTVSSLVPFTILSIYMQPMSEELGVTVGQLAMVPAISTVGGIVSALLIGRLMKVLNPRIMIVIGGATVFALYFTISVAHSIVPIYIAALFNGIGTVWSGVAMAQIIITMWFAKGRGTMMSAAMVAMGVAMVAAIPIAGTQVAAVGYRPVVMVVAIVAGVGILVSAAISSGSPDKYGLAPLGAEMTGTGDDTTAAAVPSLPWSVIVRNPVFWAIWVIVVLATVVAQGFSSQAAVVFGSLGLDQVAAAFAFSLFSLVGLPMQFLFGVVSDKFGPK